MSRRRSEKRLARRAGVVMWVKTCRTCGLEKPIGDFPVAHRRDGVEHARGHCTPCQRTIDRDRARAARKDPQVRARMNAASARWRARKQLEDPAYFAELQRIDRRLVRERQDGLRPEDMRRGRPVVTMGPDPQQPKMPAKPLADFIERYARAHNAGISDTCLELGVSPRTLSRWATGEIARVQFNHADHVITRAGAAWDDIYQPPVAER